MGPQDNPEAFLELYKRSAAVRGLARGSVGGSTVAAHPLRPAPLTYAFPPPFPVSISSLPQMGESELQVLE